MSNYPHAVNVVSLMLDRERERVAQLDVDDDALLQHSFNLERVHFLDAVECFFVLCGLSNRRVLDL